MSREYAQGTADKKMNNPMYAIYIICIYLPDKYSLLIMFELRNEYEVKNNNDNERAVFIHKYFKKYSGKYFFCEHLDNSYILVCFYF
jgi:hypothetical protein